MCLKFVLCCLPQVFYCHIKYSTEQRVIFWCWWHNFYEEEKRTLHVQMNIVDLISDHKKCLKYLLRPCDSDLCMTSKINVLPQKLNHLKLITECVKRFNNTDGQTDRWQYVSKVSRLIMILILNTLKTCYICHIFFHFFPTNAQKNSCRNKCLYNILKICKI